MKKIFSILLISIFMIGAANAALFPGFGGGGGGAQVPEVPVPPSPFASDAARDTYYSTNFAELRNDPDSVYTVVEVTGGSTFRWSGDDTPSSYTADQWQVLAAESSPEMVKTLYESNPNTNAFTDADNGAVTSIISLPSGTIPMSTGSALGASGMVTGVVNGISRVTIDGELAPRSGGGLRLGQNDIGGGGNIYGGGSALRYTNTVNDTESYPIVSLVTNAGSGDAFYPKFDILRNDPSPADKSETFTGSPGHRFAFNNPLPGRVIEYTLSNPSATTFTGCNFTIWENAYDDPNPLFDFADSNPAPIKTFTIPLGDTSVTPPEPIGFPVTGTRIFSEIICASGNVQLAGQTIPFPLDPLDPGGATEDVEFPYLEFERNFSVQQFLEDSLGNPASDGQVLTSTALGVRSWIDAAVQADHPLTLRSGMPSETEAQALLDDSEGQNSALWIVSEDQAAAANRAGATIQAERSGMLDLDGDEIPTTATTANTLQLRVGTVLKIMASNEYRVLSSPLYNTDVTNNSAVEIQQNGVQVVAAATVINFVGNGVTVTEVGGVATVTITGTVNPPQASHSNFIALTADNLAATVDTAAAIVSDDLNPTVTLPTFTGNRYIQILQSQAHTAFTSIVLSGINQFGAFTVTENARTIDGQAYRQYVTTNLITDAVSGQTLTMSGAN